jgi:hypothetical protein
LSELKGRERFVFDQVGGGLRKGVDGVDYRICS